MRVVIFAKQDGYSFRQPSGFTQGIDVEVPEGSKLHDIKGFAEPFLFVPFEGGERYAWSASDVMREAVDIEAEASASNRRRVKVGS